MTKPNSQPLPLRGVAMILIAVALLLVGWGAYSATQKDDSTDVVVTQETTEAQATPSALATRAATTPTQVQSETPESNSGENASSQGQAQATKPQVTVHVLNNSTVQGLAAKAKESLESQGYSIGHVGNYANSIVPQNTVYYSDNNEAQAQELASVIGGVAEKRPEGLPSETEGSNALVVVLANDF